MPLSRLITNILWVPILLGSVWVHVTYLDLTPWLAIPLGVLVGMICVLAVAALTNRVFSGPNQQ